MSYFLYWNVFLSPKLSNDPPLLYFGGRLCQINPFLAPISNSCPLVHPMDYAGHLSLHRSPNFAPLAVGLLLSGPLPLTLSPFPVGSS